MDQIATVPNTETYYVLLVLDGWSNKVSKIQGRVNSSGAKTRPQTSSSNPKKDSNRDKRGNLRNSRGKSLVSNSSKTSKATETQKVAKRTRTVVKTALATARRNQKQVLAARAQARVNGVTCSLI